MRIANASAVLFLLAAPWVAFAPALAADPTAVKRGEYVFKAAGCKGCHTDKKRKGAFLAGGRPLETAFGTFYGPNITPDPDFGIGKWTAKQFYRAMRFGMIPDFTYRVESGEPEERHFFPAFPFRAYTLMTDRDIGDLWAYLQTVPSVAKADKPHDLKPPFGWRAMVLFWKILFYEKGPFSPDPAKDDDWNRGAYLVRALGHCSECHTPRNGLGGPVKDMNLAGTSDGPKGKVIPNITPDKATGIGKWSADDLDTYFTGGMLPDGDFAGGAMSEVIDNTTSQWTKTDRRAVIAYLRSLPAIRNQLKRSPGR